MGERNVSNKDGTTAQFEEAVGESTIVAPSQSDTYMSL